MSPPTFGSKHITCNYLPSYSAIRRTRRTRTRQRRSRFTGQAPYQDMTETTQPWRRGKMKRMGIRLFGLPGGFWICPVSAAKPIMWVSTRRRARHRFSRSPVVFTIVFRCSSQFKDVLVRAVIVLGRYSILSLLPSCHFPSPLPSSLYPLPGSHP